MNSVLWLILALVGIIVILALVIRHLAHKAQQAYAAASQRQSRARQIGINQVTGNISQILGTWALLAEYDEIMLLSSTSAQSSLDLMGLKDDMLDIIEIKKSGAQLTSSERRLYNLIQDGRLKVRYRIVDVTLPDGVNVKTRKP